MNHSSLIQWLRDSTSLGQIEEAILSAIAEKLCSVDLPANSTLAVTGEFVSGLWILETGGLASPQPTAVPVDLLPGTVINAAALISGQPSTETVRTQTDCRCWFLSQSDFAQLRTTYPQLAPLFTQVLTRQIAKLSSQISVEQQRQQLLRPYLVNNARRGVIGKSRFAVRLRSQVIEAAKNREPVLIFGEPGQEKDNLAALIHFGSAQRRLPLIQVDCDKLQSNAAE
ncbi:MAG: cyclic nucleotide-binding domain-containing protein, partial [Cyanobacteria bacterium P01_H01_bin.15]